LAVFVINLYCPPYFVVSGGLVTDFIEPQNLFCLSLLSPPNDVLDGTCASRPEKELFNTKRNFKLERLRNTCGLMAKAGR